jgi:hypothetical protein
MLRRRIARDAVRQCPAAGILEAISFFTSEEKDILIPFPLLRRGETDFFCAAAAGFF